MKSIRMMAYALVMVCLAGVAAAGDGPVNPNLATAEQLGAIEGLTDEMARKLIDGRPFADMTAVHAAIDGDEALYTKLFLPLNLNHASKDEILLVPGVGDRMAHEFDEYRPYKAMAQFHREIGKYVDDDELARLAQFVFVPVNLNTATDEAILAIPGVGKRMLHEFKEYRPYKAIEQFRREIGKYVDDDELARLERYVTLGD